MARFPLYAPSALSMPGAVYSPFADQLRDHPGPLYPLHVGDTWLEPFAGGRMEDLSVDQNPGMHRYVDTRGVHVHDEPADPSVFPDVGIGAHEQLAVV